MMHCQTGTAPMISLFGEPGSSAGKAQPAASRPDPTEGNRKIRVIVIDDETLIAETVAEILRQEGFEAVAVSAGRPAVELAKTWLPDIVLSDVIMPGENGIETGVRIRELVPGCKVILFSGQAATVDLLEDARRHGHRFEILAKPIKPEQLISIIRSSVDS